MELLQLTRLRDAVNSPYAASWDFSGFYRCPDRLRGSVYYGDSSCRQLRWEADMLRLIGWRMDSRLMPDWQENARQVVYYGTFVRSRYDNLYHLARRMQKNHKKQAQFDSRTESLAYKLGSYSQCSLEKWMEVKDCLGMADEVRQKAKEWRIHNSSDLIVLLGGGQTWEGIEAAVSVLNYMMALYEMTIGIWESVVWDIERVRTVACTDKRAVQDSLKELRSAYMAELWHRYGEILMNAFYR